jgi:hypothetical protein
MVKNNVPFLALGQEKQLDQSVPVLSCIMRRTKGGRERI